MASRKPDKAVFTAYGWDPSMSDEEVLEKHLALNLERAEQENRDQPRMATRGAKATLVASPRPPRVVHGPQERRAE